jgi:hypothetical protein
MSTTSGAGGSATPSSTTATTATGGTTSSTTPSSSSSSGAGGGDITPSGYTCSGKQPKLSTGAYPIISANCASLACHGADGAVSTPQRAYHYFVNVPSQECPERLLVKPSDPEHSYMINKITGTNLCEGYPPMPKGGELMASTDVQTIYDWICSGALDD